MIYRPDGSEEWTTLTLKNVEPYNDNTRIYHFGFDGENAENKTSGMTVASCIMIKSPEGVVVDSKGKPIIRYVIPLTALTLDPTLPSPPPTTAARSS